MANRLYSTYKQALLGAGVNLATGTVKAVLVDTGVYSPGSGDQFLSDVPASARLAAVTLSNKTVTGGTFDAADAAFGAITAGGGTAAQAEALVLYVDTGMPGTSRLVAYIDLAVGLPVTFNGGTVTVTWDQAGIFSL